MEVDGTQSTVAAIDDEGGEADVEGCFAGMYPAPGSARGGTVVRVGKAVEENLELVHDIDEVELVGRISKKRVINEVT